MRAGPATLVVPADAAAGAAVLDAFHRYERALVAGDVRTMMELFLNSPETLRFGIADQQVGYEELARWRSRQPPTPPGRRLFQTRVMLLGDGAAVVTTLFDYPHRPVLGRQSQTWVRTEDGWRIRHAHVSEIAAGPPGTAGPAGP